MSVKKGSAPKTKGAVKKVQSAQPAAASSKRVSRTKPVAVKKAVPSSPGAVTRRKSKTVPSSQATNSPKAKPVAPRKAVPGKVALPGVLSAEGKGAGTVVGKTGKREPKAAVDVKAASSGSSSAVNKEPKRRVAPSTASKDVWETGSTISTGNGTAAAASSVMRDHASIAKGIAERKAAAKAKSIARRSRPLAEKNRNRKKLTPKQSKDYENMLLRLRDEISRQIAYLRGASLTRSDEVNPEEDGSDAFERQLALKLASNEGDAIFEIDEALQRIKEGSYGICEDCGCVVSPARLKALPFARRCVVCKSTAEKNRGVNDRRYF